MEEEELYTAISAIVKQRFYISLPALPLSLEGRSPFIEHTSELTLIQSESQLAQPHSHEEQDQRTGLL